MVGILQFLLLLLVAGICGAVGQSLAGYSHGGCLSSVALGFIGAVLGGWIASRLELPLYAVEIGGHPFPIIWSIAGAALFVGLLSFLTGFNR